MSKTEIELRTYYDRASEYLIRMQARVLIDIGNEWDLDILRELLVREILARTARHARERQ
jgi:hypothetical protein